MNVSADMLEILHTFTQKTVHLPVCDDYWEFFAFVFFAHNTKVLNSF